MDEKDFIVAYSTSRCDIGRAIYYSNLVSEYQYALSRWSYKKWGDIVGYNNQSWCSVRAENAADALNEFFKKLKNERSDKNATARN